jgi:nucleoside 2-deoxyribosyltransferase
MPDKPRVYLSGGFQSEWQTKVIAGCGEDFVFYNPKDKSETYQKDLTEEEKERQEKSQRPCHWWAWDIYAIRKADIVFVYQEDYRPKLLGPGNILELGMAIALNKLIIFVNELDHRYFNQFSDLGFPTFKTLDEGIQYLKSCKFLK